MQTCNNGVHRGLQSPYLEINFACYWSCRHGLGIFIEKYLFILFVVSAALHLKDSMWKADTGYSGFYSIICIGAVRVGVSLIINHTLINVHILETFLKVVSTTSNNNSSESYLIIIDFRVHWKLWLLSWIGREAVQDRWILFRLFSVKRFVRLQTRRYINASVMLCSVMLCYVMLCYVMLCYVMLCYVMLCYVMLCYVMLYILCYVILCYVMLC